MGFTLIELIVVVAIIGILAAIALPNFLDAQTRAKVARVRSDLRVIAGALETYRTDHGTYPPASGVGPHSVGPQFVHPVARRLIPLTTPIAYVTSVPQDPYVPRETIFPNVWYPSVTYDTYDYVDVPTKLGEGSGLSSGGIWRVMSAGPDLMFAAGGVTASQGDIDDRGLGVDYDPTNGAVSTGEIVRVSLIQAPTTGGGAPGDLNNPQRPEILRVPTYREQY